MTPQQRPSSRSGRLLEGRRQACKDREETGCLATRGARTVPTTSVDGGGVDSTWMRRDSRCACRPSARHTQRVGGGIDSADVFVNEFRLIAGGGNTCRFNNQSRHRVLIVANPSGCNHQDRLPRHTKLKIPSGARSRNVISHLPVAEGPKYTDIFAETL